MKMKIFVLGLVYLLHFYCASSGQFNSHKPFQELYTYENIRFDHLWKSCELALKDLGYTIYEANKDEGLIKAFWRELKIRKKISSYLNVHSPQGSFSSVTAKSKRNNVEVREDVDFKSNVHSQKPIFPRRSTHLCLHVSQQNKKVYFLFKIVTKGGPSTKNRHTINWAAAKIFFDKFNKILMKRHLIEK